MQDVRAITLAQANLVVEQGRTLKTRKQEGSESWKILETTYQRLIDSYNQATKQSENLKVKTRKVCQS